VEGVGFGLGRGTGNEISGRDFKSFEKSRGLGGARSVSDPMMQFPNRKILPTTESKLLSTMKTIKSHRTFPQSTSTVKLVK